MLRFITYALPALLLLLALFGFAVELLDAEPRQGSVIRLALFDTPLVPAPVVLGAWLMEASGLLALFLLARGRCGTWWLDGLMAGWLGWIFRGPLLVITIVVATRQPQDPWWTLAFGWWVLYSICGLFLAFLAHRSDLGDRGPEESAPEDGDPEDHDPQGSHPEGSHLKEPEAAKEVDTTASGTESNLLDRSTSPDGAPFEAEAVEEKLPLEEPETAVETYLSPEEETAEQRGVEDNAVTRVESTLTVDQDTSGQPESEEAKPKPSAEET